MRAASFSKKEREFFLAETVCKAAFSGAFNVPD